MQSEETNHTTKKRLGRRARRQYAGRVLFIAGAVLVVLALGIYLYNVHLAKVGGDNAELVMGQILDGEGEVTDDGLLLDGNLYIGYLTVPDLDLQLPVMRECTMDNLEIAPCRYYGEVETGDLVIAGHNYKRVFAPLKFEDVGTEVIFTDIRGNDYYYEISEKQTVQPTDIDKMIGENGDRDWDMTLFTCTTGGKARCAIRCVRTDT